MQYIPGQLIILLKSYNFSWVLPISTAASSRISVSLPLYLSWTPSAMQTLKGSFTSAPFLIHPNPNKPFVVEVDTSTTGVGAVLSQQQGKPSRLHPCVFSSKKLTLEEQNYDIGNCELLAIKLALGEWRYWLEAHNFIMLTDHHNLEYL